MDDIYSTFDSAIILNASFIKVNVTMGRAIELMGNAFTILSAKSAHVPPRVVMSTPDNSMSVFFKPAFLSQYQRMSIKILTQITPNENRNGPTIKGMVLLIDLASGRMLSISDGNYTTALRTGAASGIATKLLANPDSSVLAVFGCGAQGRTQAEAVLEVRPIKKIILFDAVETQAVIMAREIHEKYGINCTVNPVINTLKEADVICTATQSNKPLFTLANLKPGVHINAVGSYRPDMQELDPEILGVALTYLDDAPACLYESGDLIMPLKMGIIEECDIMGEIGDLIAGKITGRKGAGDITIFKTVGNAIQDFFIANEAYEKSLSVAGTQVINLTS